SAKVTSAQSHTGTRCRGTCLALEDSVTLSSYFSRRKENMKKLTLLLSILFTAGVAMAADAPADSKAPAKPAAATSSDKTAAKADVKAMTHEVTAEVVSVNAEKK